VAKKAKTEAAKTWLTKLSAPVSISAASIAAALAMVRPTMPVLVAERPPSMSCFQSVFTLTCYIPSCMIPKSELACLRSVALY